MDSPCSPAPEPKPVQSLRSPELQQQFFSELQGRRGFHGDDSPDSAPAAPVSPAPSAPQSPAPSSPRSSPGVSPQLVAELKESQSRPRKPVPQRTGKTTIFSGRGSDKRPSANQDPPSR